MENSKRCLFEDYIWPNVCPIAVAFKLEKKIKDNMSKKDEALRKIASVEIPNEQDMGQVIAGFEKSYEQEIERRAAFDDKAKASLFVITLSLSLILGSLNYIKALSGNLAFKTITLAFVVLAVLYLITAGITALKAINVIDINETHTATPTMTGDTLHASLLSAKDIIKEHHSNTALNREVNYIKSNHVYATFLAIRNGIILLTAFFIFAVGAGYLTDIEQQNAVSSKSKTGVSRETTTTTNSSETTANPNK